MFPTDVGVGYFEGSAYQPRFGNPIIIDGYLYYTEPIAFTGPSSGPTVCVNLRNRTTTLGSTTIPPLSFGYVYNLWTPTSTEFFHQYYSLQEASPVCPLELLTHTQETHCST